MLIFMKYLGENIAELFVLFTQIIVYRIDEKGIYSPEDLVMLQGFTSYYNTKKSVIHISWYRCLPPTVPM